MNRLVECVPNFSEGRRPETIDALVETIHSVPGAVVLDRQSDADHNRSVLTFIGPPEAVAEAYLALHRQPADAWTFEQEIRPFGEQW